MSEPTQDTQLDKKKGREILKLKAKEVSMVDRPAILREFLVVKRQTEDNMGAFESENTQAEPQGDTLIEAMTWKSYEDIDKALPIDLRNAIKAVSAFLGKSKSAEGAPTKEIERVMAFLGKVEGGKYPYPSAEGMTKAEKKPEEMTPEEQKKAEEEQKKKEAEEKAKQEAAQKNAEGFMIKITPDGGVEMSGQPVSKAGKAQFTTTRSNDLKDAVEKLLKMLAGVDVDATKGIIEELVKSTLPADLKWTSGTQAVPASVKKVLEEVVEPVNKRLEEIGTKVEAMEKSRPAPQSSGGDGDTHEEHVNKGQNTWDGLPLPR